MTQALGGSAVRGRTVPQRALPTLSPDFILDQANGKLAEHSGRLNI